MATKNSMTVKTFLEVVPHLAGNVSILLRGDHGIGKSQIVRQVAKIIASNENIPEFEVIDRRLSQMSEGDMIGLPSTDGNVTRFNPPNWYKDACLKPCVLFLDELNRATHEVMQAAFQIVLDRELNGWKLHPQTRVFSAINSSANYTVNEIDPALLDRFWVLDLNPSTNDWLTWARSDLGNIHPSIVDFITAEDKWLDPPMNAELGTVHPSRRSWERLSRTLESAGVADDPNHTMFYPLCLGFIGVDATIKFTDFAKSIDNRVSGEEVINSYSKVKAKLERMGPERLNGVIEKVTEYVGKECKKLTDKQGKNLQTFMELLPGELRVSCWQKLTTTGIDKLDLARSLHKWCTKTVLDVFGVPMGPAGVGVVPNIPSMFDESKKENK